MPNIRAFNLRDRLLSGALDAASLQTILTTSTEDYAAFAQITNSLYSFDPLANIPNGLTAVSGSAAARLIIVSSPEAIRALANSDYATEQMVKLANPGLILAEILKDTTGGRFSHWRNYSANYQRIKQWVNASGSKLKRTIFLSSGTWTAPATTLAFSSYLAGGAGAGGASAAGAGGGGGGELKTNNLASGMPTANQSVTVGAGGAGVSSGSNGNNGTATTVGSIVSADFGRGGVAGGAGGIGGGTTTGRGWRDFTDSDPYSAPWQCVNASQKGGDGGSNAPTSGGDGYPNTGGRPSIGGAYAPGPGLGLGGGGGGADGSASSNGSNPAANIAAGSPGADQANSRTASSGFAVIHHLEA